MTYEVARVLENGNQVAVLSRHPNRASAELARCRAMRDRPGVTYVVLGLTENDKAINSITTLDRYLARTGA